MLFNNQHLYIKFSVILKGIHLKLMKTWDQTIVCESNNKSQVMFLTLLYFHREIVFLTALLRYNSQTTKSTHLKCAIQCFFSVFTELCNYHSHLICRTFCHSQKETLYFEQSCVPHSYLQSQATTNLLSASIDLPILDISYK